MTRRDHWNRVGEGKRVWELCDMVSVNIIINIMYYQHAKVSNKHV